MATVRLAGVSKIYRGNTAAVSDVSLDAEDGEFLALVGPSGCGKSTVLNLIAGLDQPSAGVVSIDGQPVNDRSPRERDVAMVFQSYALYPHLDVRGNLAFPLEAAGLSRPDIGARVGETAALLGLTDLLAHKPAQLSGGQRQRVALGRALVRRPKVFLFDEPLSNLDAGLRSQLRAELKKLHERLRATFIYVTHDQTEAMTLADRIVVMRAGRVEQIATPRALYTRPASTFVAEFFGSPRINLLRPEIVDVEAPHPNLTLGLRPEHLEVSTQARQAAIKGRVYLVEPTGAESWVTAQVNGETVVGRAPPFFDLQSGADVFLHVAKDALLWFDDEGRAV